LLLPSLATAQMGLKPRLYTTGSTLRRAFAEVATHARAATVQVLDDDQRAAFGIVVGADGWIITKASELGPKPSVRLSDGETYPAELAGVHDGTDLALLKIGAQDLTPIEWDTSASAIGQWVVSTGDRETPEAIGVVGASRRRIERERVPGVLGVKLDGDDGPPTVVHVFPNSGAEAAGIKVGDVVQQLNGNSITSRVSMISRIQKLNPGDAIKLSILREEEQLELTATLTPPTNEEFLSRIAIQNRMGGDLSERRTGFESVIQHDSVLRPDECGGPAVGLSGKAIGINIARAGRTETYALPAELVLPVIDQLKLQAPKSVVSME
jgi:serine protease Do